MEEPARWDWKISPAQKWYDFNWQEFARYRGLVRRFVKRDLLSNYHQTVMGSFWLVLQPLLTTLVFVLIFGNIMKISTDGFPSLLFYLTGNVLWGFFSDCFNGSMYSFRHNLHIFKKIYFPRLIIPVSVVLTHAFRLLIQFVLLIAITMYYVWTGDQVELTWRILLFPLLILLTACFAMGLGLLVSTFSVKYKDLENFMQYFLRLYMFASPIVYPSSIVGEKYEFLFWLNPLTPLVETFRSGFAEAMMANYTALGVAAVLITGIFVLGVVLFKKRELKVMDYL